MANSIDRIENPTVEEFWANYLSREKPVIITGVVDKWPAFGKWNPDYLEKSFGDRMLPITAITDGDYCNAQRNELSIKDYLNYLNSGHSGTTKYYLAELPVKKHLPELEDDMIIPEYFNKREGSAHSVFYVGKDNFSQLHYHEYGSAVCSILYGEKNFRLFPPSESRKLYKYPFYTRLSNMSKTTSLTPDMEKFPLYYKAEPIDLTLKQGEMLFIPIYWWHSIQNFGLNMATVTFWGRDIWYRKPPPALMVDYLYELVCESPSILKSIPERVINKLRKH